MKTYKCVCGELTTRHNWCYAGKHVRISPKGRLLKCSQCGRQQHAKSLCRTHYMQLYRATVEQKPRKQTKPKIIINSLDLWDYIKQELQLT